MLDIDRFKNFNDTYGHLAGDQGLRTVADAIKKFARRPGDLVARYGGEEFIIMLLGTSEDTAVQISEEIRHKIETIKIEIDSYNSGLTVSLGVAATIPDTSKQPDFLVNAADQALYQAKKKGRNRVVKFSTLRESGCKHTSE